MIKLFKSGKAAVLALVFASLLPVQASAQEPTASQLAVGRAVVLGSGISRSFETVVPQMMDQIARNLLQTRPELGKDLNTVMDMLEPEFKGRQDDMVNAASRIFVKRMSEAELTEVAAFFSSPIGKKYVESQPAMLDEVVVLMQAFTQKISTDLFARVKVEMKKKGHDL